MCPINVGGVVFCEWYEKQLQGEERNWSQRLIIKMGVERKLNLVGLDATFHDGIQSKIIIGWAPREQNSTSSNML